MNAGYRIATIFIAGVCIALSLTAFAAVRSGFDPGATSVITKVVQVFSGPLGVIIGGLFATRRARGRRYSRGQVSLAVILSLLWNVIVLAIVGSFVFIHGNPELATAWLENDTTVSFLIAGVLSVFFSASDDSSNQVRQSP